MSYPWAKILQTHSLLFQGGKGAMGNFLINGKAQFSSCMVYRYSLERKWIVPRMSKRLCAFIMLNPSTADAEVDDPTTRRCMTFARQTGHDRYAAVNLFAYRAARPADMIAAKEPVGIQNDYWIRHFVGKAKAQGTVVCAWGTHGIHMERDKVVLSLLIRMGVKPLCLRVTKDGYPEHPLYIPAPWRLVALEMEE